MLYRFFLVFIFTSSTLLGTTNLTYQMHRGGNEPTKKSYSYATFKVENVPANVHLTYKLRKLDGSLGEETSVTVNEVGDLIDKLSGKLWILEFGEFMKGEPIEALLCTKDEILASARMIPWPIEKKDDQGHTLSIIMSHPVGVTYKMEATGFEPFEDVELCFISDAENRTDVLKASSQGTIMSVLTPTASTNLGGGRISIELKGKNTKDLEVRYNWGFKGLRTPHVMVNYTGP